MAIKFKVIERGQPGVTGGGEKKFYASAQTNGDMTLAGLTKAIERSSTVAGADIRAVLYALVDVMQDSLEEGKIVRMGDLGSLRITIRSNGEANPEDVTSSSIRQAKVIFTPGSAIREMLINLKYSKE